jgi:hypothetical protein
MTTYIAGPMTGYPAFNYPEFHYVAGVLRSKGVEVINPAELHGEDDTGGDHPWEYYLRVALKAVLECDEVVLLKGWQQSRGAVLERHVAEQLGMKISEWAGSAA